MAEFWTEEIDIIPPPSAELPTDAPWELHAAQRQ